jgi:hypothetical protein
MGRDDMTNEKPMTGQALKTMLDSKISENDIVEDGIIPLVQAEIEHLKTTVEEAEKAHALTCSGNFFARLKAHAMGETDGPKAALDQAKLDLRKAQENVKGMLLAVELAEDLSITIGDKDENTIILETSRRSFQDPNSPKIQTFALHLGEKTASVDPNPNGYITQDWAYSSKEKPVLKFLQDALCD